MTTRITKLAGLIKTEFQDIYTSPAVLWCGANGTGKTSREEAMDLVSTGKRRKGAGKAKDLAPPDAGHAAAAMEFVVIDGSGACGAPQVADFDTRKDWIAVAGVPTIVRPARWLIQLGPARAREELIKRWGGDAAKGILDAPKSLSKEQKAHWAAGVAAVRAEIADKKKGKKKSRATVDELDIDAGEIDEDDGVADDDATVLAKLQGWARRQKLAQSDRANALRAALDGLPKTASGEDPTLLRSRLAQAEAWDRYAPQRVRRDQLAASIERFNAAVVQFTALPQLPPRDTSQIDALDAQIKEADRYVAWVETVVSMIDAAMTPSSTMSALEWIVRRVTNHTGACDWAAARADMLVPLQQTTSARAQLEATRDAMRRQLAPLDEAYAERERQRTQLEVEHARIQNESQTITVALEGMVEYVGEPADALRARLAVAAAVDAQTRSREEQATAIETATIEKARYEAVEDAASIALKNLTVEVSARFNDAIESKLLGRTHGKFSFDFLKCKFAMIGSDGRPHAWREMGGGELAALDIAFARAWARPEEAPVLLLEYERDFAPFDLDNRKKALAELARAALDGELAMVAMASPIPPDERYMPVGPEWQTIYTDAVGVSVTATAAIASLSAPQPVAPLPTAPRVATPQAVIGPSLTLVPADPSVVPPDAPWRSAVPPSAYAPSLNTYAMSALQPQGVPSSAPTPPMVAPVPVASANGHTTSSGPPNLAPTLAAPMLAIVPAPLAPLHPMSAPTATGPVAVLPTAPEPPRPAGRGKRTTADEDLALATNTAELIERASEHGPLSVPASRGVLDRLSDRADRILGGTYGKTAEGADEEEEEEDEEDGGSTEYDGDPDADTSGLDEDEGEGEGDDDAAATTDGPPVMSPAELAEWRADIEKRKSADLDKARAAEFSAQRKPPSKRKAPAKKKAAAKAKTKKAGKRK